MALDGIYLSTIVKNLKNTLTDCKIDKINQPEKDEIILTFRKERKNIKLLISASPRFARIHITENTKKNPITAPIFLMVLRKYLLNGKILDIYQKDGDRIVILKIENTDELGFNSTYSLIVEIMGRHSNITLVRNRDNKVMECIKHITSNINSYRVLYPGTSYVYPPAANKLNPFSFNFETFSEYISNNFIEFNDSFYSSVFTGISRLLSTELYYMLTQINSSPTRIEIYDHFNLFIENLNTSENFVSYCDIDHKLKDYYCVSLKTLKKQYSETKYNNPNLLMDDFYLKKDTQDRLLNKSTDLQKLINTNLDRCMKKKKILEETLRECLNKDIYKIKGDLLTSFIYSIEQGSTECKLLNFYNEDCEEYLTIQLDPNKTPSYNIQKYYKKYNKLKASESHAALELEKNNKEMEYLNSVLTNILNAESYDEIDEIKKELVLTNYIRNKRNSKNNKSKPSKPLMFTSSDNIEIYVGKNNIQNDYLSLKFANKNYLWLHAKNIPGSHVIICSFNVPDKTLKEAAIIAGYYSKGKAENKLSIDYTKVKELKKPKGAKPGMVIYHTNNTIVINPNDFNSLYTK